MSEPEIKKVDKEILDILFEFYLKFGKIKKGVDQSKLLKWFSREVERIYNQYEIYKIEDEGVQLYLIDTIMWYNIDFVFDWLKEILYLKNAKYWEDIIEKLSKADANLIVSWLIHRRKSYYDDFFNTIGVSKKEMKNRSKASSILGINALYRSMLKKKGVNYERN